MIILFLFSHHGAAFESQLPEIIRQLGFRNSDEKEIREILNEFVERKLMYSENHRYLSLALPSNPA